MREQQPPELADGGYWYVVSAVPDASEGGRTPGDISAGWCAWYGVVNTVACAAVRTVQPAGSVKTVDLSAAAVLSAAGATRRPRARIAGA